MCHYFKWFEWVFLFTFYPIYCEVSMRQTCGADFWCWGKFSIFQLHFFTAIHLVLTSKEPSWSFDLN